MKYLKKLKKLILNKYNLNRLYKYQIMKIDIIYIFILIYFFIINQVVVDINLFFIVIIKNFLIFITITSIM